MHKIAESPMNTGFLRLCIYTFRYFEKRKQKIISLKITDFYNVENPHTAQAVIFALQVIFAAQVIF